jgi:DNA recombination protein RmuC
MSVEMMIIVGLLLVIITLTVIIGLKILIAFKARKDYTADFSRLDSLIREEFSRNREENARSFKDSREELGASFKEIRETMERRLHTIQEENARKLEEMRKVVDEKLQETVEKRFNESFKMISDRLEQVHKGLGEMQTLASGVGDLKKVLTNVKTRGNLGEIQLDAILRQILSPEQYEENAAIKEGSMERVEFAVKLPGKGREDQIVLLPIDSKFPNEDYQRLLDAYENAGNLTPKELDGIQQRFENSVKKNAKDIRDKYINPPHTTDFAIMFVPTEGLYAEILRRTGLFESLQRDYKITVVGPANLVAFLSSLQMGFKTLAIEKRSSEVWEILGAVKTEFGNFGGILDKTQKKLQEAANVIEQAGRRSRAIERKLRDVQELPQTQAVNMLGEFIEPEEEETN